MGRGGGNGPSLFELHLRAAARLGTTDAFEKAFDFAIRRTAPLANIPHIITGDINTTSRKRKGQATSTIHPTDTHRHDRVAVTTQVKRTVRGRLAFDFEHPQHAVTEPRESSRPPVSTVTAVTTLSTSTDDSAELERQMMSSILNLCHEIWRSRCPEEPEFEVPEEPYIAVPAEPEFEAPGSPYFADPAEPEFEAPGTPYFAVPADPEIAVPQPYIADPDEPEVVVLGVTPMRRSNTRASMTRQREHINEVMQHGQAIKEQIVDKRFWHLSRINQGGHPSCNAAMVGRNAPKAFCKTRIKSSGLSIHGMPVVAPSFVGYTRFNGVERQNQFWFCPKMACIKSKGTNACRFQMPQVPDVMPVQLGTKITQAECDFLTVNGFVLVHRIPSTTQHAQDFPSNVDIRINVDLYAQKIQSVPSIFRFGSRGIKTCRRKTTTSNECMKRLQSARTTTMLMTGQWEVREGNGYGKMFQISTHLGADMKRYIVQLCCFSTCSCEDFLLTQMKTFTPCKHIY
ncbi:hypothetical protein R1sor_014409 [Riccia sorocarpa]|uniref:SWIM-type domain-containing protein n=1 Tax=Riccia sorocarpa TaxID=122646 RepID=A0ABD3HD46_9MARC